MSNNKIKQIRTEKNMSLLQLYAKSGVSDGYISDLENGKKGNPTIKTLKKIAEALDVEVNDLL